MDTVHPVPEPLWPPPFGQKAFRFGPIIESKCFTIRFPASHRGKNTAVSRHLLSVVVGRNGIVDGHTNNPIRSAWDVRAIQKRAEYVCPIRNSFPAQDIWRHSSDDQDDWPGRWRNAPPLTKAQHEKDLLVRSYSAFTCKYMIFI